MGRVFARSYDCYDDDYDDAEDSEPLRWPRRKRPRRTDPDRPSRRERRAARRPETEAFRCRHCRAMVGPAASGSRHRNHCPFCLHSRHVDARRPGDRASTCRATMAPVALWVRPSGDQVLVHRCLGCGTERWNRVAADDNPLAVMSLNLLPGPLGQGREAGEASA